MKKLLLVMWQLPTVLLGVLVLAILKIIDSTLRYDNSGYYNIFYTRYRIGVCFGPIIIMYRYADPIHIQHESGHATQSRILGWLYLILVGLPSITANILTRMHILNNSSYYSRYPENWADSLGGIPPR